MKRDVQELEPDLLQVFRLFMIWQAVMLMVWVGLQMIAPEPSLLRHQWLAAAVPLALIAYCSSEALRRWLGRAYLPLALAVASLGQLLTYALIVRLRIADGIPAHAMLSDAWLLIIALLLPSIIVAWQYGPMMLVGFCVASVVIDLALLLPVAAHGGPQAMTIIAVALVRVLFFLPVGYAVARLVAAQRLQREALAQANERLAHHAATLEQLATSRERNRLARELHDTLAHTLSALAVQLEAASAIWHGQAERARGMLGDALGMTRRGLADARRAIQALRAAPLEDLGLVGALRELARTTTERAGIALDLQVCERVDGLSTASENAIYRIAEEALANVVRHAQASRVQVRLDAGQLTIADDGRGFDPAGFDPTVAGASDRYGLRGMHERAAPLGGRLEIASGSGAGTTVRLNFGGGK